MARIKLLLLLVSLLAGLLFYKNWWTDGDEGRYVALARSVSTGHGLSHAYLPGCPKETLTPVLYPTILGGVDFASGHRVVALRWFSFLMYLGVVYLLIEYVFNLKQYSVYSHIAMYVMSCLPVIILSFTWQIMSEMTYLFFTLLALSLMGGRRRGSSCLSGCVAGISMLIRPTGIVMLPVACVQYTLRRRWTGLLLFVAGMVLVAAIWPLRTFMHTGHLFGHTGHLAANSSGAIATVVAQVRNVLTSFPHYFFSNQPSMLFYSLFDHRNLATCLVGYNLSRIAAVVVALIILLGWFVSICKDKGAYECFWVFNWVLLCVYNQPDYAARGVFLYQPRYLFPLLPLSGIYMVRGIIFCIRSLDTRFKMRGAKHTGVVVVTMLVLYVGATTVGAAFTRFSKGCRYFGDAGWSPDRLSDSSLPEDIAFSEYMRAGLWIHSNLSENAVIACRKPAHIWLISGKRAFRYDADRLDESHSIWENLLAYQRFGPVYVLQDSFPGDTGYGGVRVHGLDPLIAENQEALGLVYVHGMGSFTTRVWRLKGLSEEGMPESGKRIQIGNRK